MRVIVAGLLVAITLILGVIAFDLHAMARTVGAVSGVGPYAVHMTKQQQIDSAIKNADDSLDLMEAIVKTPPPSHPKAPARRPE